MMKYLIISLVISNLMITTIATTTNNRVLLSSVLVGSALAASVYGYYNFSPEELAVLTTAVLVLNFPGNQNTAEVSCAVPGYTYNSLLGCYRIQNEPGLPYDDAKQECVNDGGRLLLVNSAAEATELASLLTQASVGGAWIQGTRATVSSPWLTDAGEPLPYIGTYVDSASSLALGMGIGSDAVFAPADVFSPLSFVCAI
nr:uncharacterized protein LOC117684663 [Crassostrea gigas]XP_034313587.1 uncharacterized protein LOC117684663 [Crassostrea gigas]